MMKTKAIRRTCGRPDRFLNAARRDGVFRLQQVLFQLFQIFIAHGRQRQAAATAVVADELHGGLYGNGVDLAEQQLNERQQLRLQCGGGVEISCQRAWAMACVSTGATLDRTEMTPCPPSDITATA